MDFDEGPERRVLREAVADLGAGGVRRRRWWAAITEPDAGSNSHRIATIARYAGLVGQAECG